MSTFDSYARIKLSANQGANLGAGQHVEFNVLSFIGTAIGAADVQLSTGVGQANGIITLNNFRYIVMAHLLGQTNEGWIAAAWTNGAGALIENELGIAGQAQVRQQFLSDSDTTDICGAPTTCWFILDATGAPIVMQNRFLGSSNPQFIYSNSYVYIVPILE